MSCPHLERCAGCPAMHLAYAEQLTQKGARLRRSLGRYPELARIEVNALDPAEPALGYRTRVKWMVGSNRELGLFARGGGHAVVDIPGCLVLDPALAEVGATLRSLIGASGAAARLRAIDARVARVGSAAPSVLVTLVSEKRALTAADVTEIATALRRACPRVAGVAWSETQRGAVQVLGSGTTLVSGASTVPDQLGSARVIATFGAFVQAHRGQAARVERAVVEALRATGEAPRVLELFAGSGAFAIAMAEAGAEVDAVESHAPASALLAERRLPRVRAHAADAEAFTVDAAKSGARWDVVVVDPPRRGLTPALRRAIAAVHPRRIAYVSCNPDTLARDLAHFCALGFAADHVRGIDMIPQTEEVEAIAVLAPFEPPHRRVLAEGERWKVVEVAAHDDVHDVALPPPHGASGLALLLDKGAARPASRWSALALVKGIVHKRGTLRGRARYARVLVAAGHSLVRVEGETPAQAAADLAGIGHPVIGDEKRCDAATRRHFFDKHGLDRPFWHTDRLELTDHAPLTSAPPGDLAAVLASMGAKL